MAGKGNSVCMVLDDMTNIWLSEPYIETPLQHIFSNQIINDLGP